MRTVIVSDRGDGRSFVRADADVVYDEGGERLRNGYGLWGCVTGELTVPVAHGHDTAAPPKVPLPGRLQVHMVSFGPTRPPGTTTGPRHRTDSVDIAFVLSGAIALVLDDGEIELRAGDCVVQEGGWHAWRNDGDQPCLVGFVMVGATRVAGQDR